MQAFAKDILSLAAVSGFVVSLTMIAHVLA